MFEGTIRLDVKDYDRDIKKLTEFLQKYNRCLLFEEISNETKKLHFQGVIWHEDEKAFNACKTRFTTWFKETHPTSSRSMAKVTSENYKVYITKDGKKVYSSGITEEEIEELHSRSYKKPEKKSVSWTEKVIEDFEKTFEWYPDYLDQSDPICRKIEVLDVVKFVRGKLADLRKPFSVKLVTDVVTLLVQLNSDKIHRGSQFLQNFDNAVLQNLHIY